MGAREHDQGRLALTRHQCVRDQGTPRVSTLVGELPAAAALWRAWLRASGRDESAASSFVEPADGDQQWLGRIAGQTLALATEVPGRPIAIVVRPERLATWLATRTDRAAAFVAEGVIALEQGVTPEGVSKHDVATDAGIPVTRPRPDCAQAQAQAQAQAHAHAQAQAHAPAQAQAHAPARSLAEAAMLQALEANASTRGRFQLNQAVSFSFGDRAAEVDLLSRGDEIAIEIDGYHHFTDLEHYRRDRKKDLLLQAHGYVVLRFLADDVLADARAAVGAVVELMGLRLGRAQRARRP